MRNAILCFIICIMVVNISFSGEPVYKTIGTIHRDTPEINNFISEDAVIEVVAEGFAWSEGPVWVKEGGYLLLSDAPNNTTYKWNEQEQLKIILRPSGYALGDNQPGRELGCNGMYINPVNG